MQLDPRHGSGRQWDLAIGWRSTIFLFFLIVLRHNLLGTY